MVNAQHLATLPIHHQLSSTLLADTYKLGIKCTIFDREAHLNQRSRDWSFGIYWAQGPLAECLPEPLRAKLNTATVDPSRTPSPKDFMRILNGETAEELTRVPMPNVCRLKRSAFRALLVEGLDVQVRQPLKIIHRFTRTLYLLILHALVWQETQCHFPR